MIIFLTSSPGGHTWEQPVKPVPLDESNGFIDNLRKFWKKDARVLFIASDPDNYDNNDFMADIFLQEHTYERTWTFGDRCL